MSWEGEKINTTTYTQLLGILINRINVTFVIVPVQINNYVHHNFQNMFIYFGITLNGTSSILLGLIQVWMHKIMTQTEECRNNCIPIGKSFSYVCYATGAYVRSGTMSGVLVFD